MTYTKAQAQVEIAKLVNTFAASEARLQNEVEAQIENNFIRPLFAYLNWNTHNIGLSGTEYEFLVQKTDRYGKRPDYILQLDGQHLLVMDAKQVKYEMHDPRWLNQVYAYAYSTQNLAPARKIDFAILTDFQEFIVLDCTLYAGDPKALPNFRVLDWRYPDYVRHFDTLWELFERENLRAAARTRGTERPAGLWARYLSPKKVKANRTPPDKTFLAEMDDDKTGWRVRLAKDMKKRNPQADGALITAAVQLLINRLIFVKALSDREIEDDYLARLAETVERDGLAERDAGWFTACRAIFEKLNKFYNGSVFEPRPELEAVSVSNKVVRDILRAMQPEQSPYNFAMLPVEILGTIYERFLGRVVRTTEQRVKIEDKPEVRKAGGVYYTPQYIVTYIVQQTVGKLLETCRTPDDVAKLKILDPACGSGSFLLGAYTALLDWHVRYYRDKTRLTKKDRAAAYYDADGGVRLTAKLKRQILLDNLFGVDIDAQAVEVTRFSLSLKALEETRHDELLEEWSLFKMTVLPDLRDNIKCGNSLIGPDYFTNQLIPDMAELKRVNPFDWTREFPEIMHNGGFDAVIGNPPYLRIQGLQEYYGRQIEYFADHYKSAVKRFDLSLLFAERSFNFLIAGGHLGFICPHKFLNSDFGSGLRQFLISNSAIESFINFGNNLIFSQAATYTGILLLKKGGNSTFNYFEFADMPISKLPDCLESLTNRDFTKYDLKNFTSQPWVLTSSSIQRVLNRLKQPNTLGESFESISQGIVTGVDDLYFLKKISDDQTELIEVFSEREGKNIRIERAILKPLLKGEDVSRYQKPDFKYYCIYPYQLIGDQTVILQEDELAQSYPLAYDYLWRYRNELRELRVKFKTNPKYWYSCHRGRSITLFESERIITPEISLGCKMTISPSGIYHNTVVYSLLPSTKFSESNFYWLGILNSQVMWWFLSNTGTVLRGGYFRFKTNYLQPFPIRAINFSDPTDKARHDKMVQLVAAMLELHTRKAVAATQTDQELYQRQLDATDRQIDALVYELYALTPEEIAIVEGGGK